ncbi:MAG: TolC family protein, partial [Armatimonadota bacterium]
RDIEIALIDLRTVMGVHPSSAIVIEGTLTYENSDGLINSLLAADKASGVKSVVDGLLRVAERNRPELRVAGFNVEGSKASRSAAVGDFNPQVSLFASGDLMKEESMPSRGGATIGVMASIPIFTGGLRSARVDEARAMLQKQESERQQIAQQVAREVQSALVGLRASEQNISTAGSALVAAKEESKASQKRYEVGKSTVVDVLDSSAAQTRAENNAIQALYDYNAAKDQLVRSVGRLETLTAND